MTVYRLHRSKYDNPLSGEGAFRYGGRWNPPGIRVVYTSASRALALTEVLVHLSQATMPSNFEMVTIRIPDEVEVKDLKKKLPEGWSQNPYHPSTQRIGNDLLVSHGCVFRLPSAVVPGDFNFLLKVDHPDFQKISVINKDPFPFDPRLFE